MQGKIYRQKFGSAYFFWLNGGQTETHRMQEMHFLGFTIPVFLAEMA